MMTDQGTRIAGSTGTIGAIIAAMSCTACFPALASLASALGLSFLGQFEGPSIRYILPLFALVGLAANIIGGRRRGWSHLIPYDSLMADDYEGFLAARADVVLPVMVKLARGEA